MKTVGIGLNINLSKLDKSRFVVGKNGTYADLTVFVDVIDKDQFGHSGGIKMALKKGETKESANLDYVGNATVFYTKGEQGAPVAGNAVAQVADMTMEDLDEDIPF